MGDVIFDVLSEAIACIPWGSFAFLQPIPPEEPLSQDSALAVLAPR